MNWLAFWRNVVFGGSAFAAGALVGLALIRLWRWFTKGHHKRDLAGFMLDTGCAGIIYEVLTQVISRTPELPANAVTFWYIIFLTLAFFGALGLMWDYLFSDDKEGQGP